MAREPEIGGGAGAEARLLRARVEALESRVARLGGGGPGGAARLLGQVYDGGALPTFVGAYYATHPAEVAAAGAAEGAPGSVSVDATRSVLMYVPNAKAPAAGEYLVGHAVDYRWAAERPGGSSSNIIIPGCPCTSSPATLTMTSSKPLSNNKIFQNATLQYGPTPAGLAPLQLGASCYLSTTTFTDNATNDQFWYYFTCYFNYYILTRVYLTSAYGSPYRDQIRYRWLVGLSGNTCSPFLVSRGAVYAGGDSTCVVTVSG